MDILLSHAIRPVYVVDCCGAYVSQILKTTDLRYVKPNCIHNYALFTFYNKAMYQLYQIILYRCN